MSHNVSISPRPFRDIFMPKYFIWNSNCKKDNSFKIHFIFNHLVFFQENLDSHSEEQDRNF